MKLQRNPFRVRFCHLAVLAALVLLPPIESIGQSGVATTGTALAASSVYFRLVRLQHGSYNGTVVASDGAVGNIWQSTNNGASFTHIATVPVISGSTLDCCATLFEMPQTVGSLSAGTLLYAATYVEGSQKAIKISISTNAGTTWSYWDTPIIGGSASNGLWEPQFEIASDGALVMFWSDETDPCCSQKLAQMRTYTGTSWESPQNTVASTIQSDRPGMATVNKLPSGIFFMTYELCGNAACTVFYRTSADGWNWGSASNMGTKLQTPSGEYFEHAPTNSWSPSVLSSNGAILVIGQMFYESNGSVPPHNGEVMLVNLSGDATGVWYAIGAPVQVPTAYNNPCPNYSSSLLPATDGSSILELTSAYNSSGVCSGYFATHSWNSLPANGSTHVLQNVATGDCLDDAGWSNQNETIAGLWSCTGTAIQNWILTSQGSGYFNISNAYTGICVDNVGGSTSPLNAVELYGCVNNNNQRWQFMDLANGTYQLLNLASGTMMLDDPGGALPGSSDAPTEINMDNTSGTQAWVVR